MKAKLIILVIFLILSVFISSCVDRVNKQTLSLKPLGSNSQLPFEIEDKTVFTYIEFKPITGIEPVFLKEMSCYDGLLRYRKYVDNQEMFGFMDLKFNIISEPITQFPSVFSNGLAWAWDSAGEKIIDESFNVIGINPNMPFVYNNTWMFMKILYIEPESYNERYSVFTLFEAYDTLSTSTVEQLIPSTIDGSLWGYRTLSSTLDNKNNIDDNYAIHPYYEYAGEFYGGLAKVKKNGKYGYLDEKGNLAINFQYDLARDFSDGFAVVGINNPNENGKSFSSYLLGLIAENGKVIIDFKYTDIKEFVGNIAVVKQDKNDYFYINREGEKQFNQNFFKATNFKNGTALVQDGTGYYFIDTNGNNLNGNTYDYAREFNEDMAVVVKDGLYGYIEWTGEYLIEPQYLLAKDFNFGYAIIKERDSGKGYVIDKYGIKYLGELNLSNMSNFNKDGYALAYSGNENKMYYVIHIDDEE